MGIAEFEERVALSAPDAGVVEWAEAPSETGVGIAG